MVAGQLFKKMIKNFINNKFLEINSNSKTFELIKFNPHNNKKLCSFKNSSSKDINMAFKAAQKSSNLWQKLSYVERSEFLKRISKIFEKKIKEISQLVSLETGKNFNTAMQESIGTLKLMNYYISEAYRVNTKVYQPSANNKKVIGLRSPMGIAVLIVPANTPLPNITWKLIPSLLYGNTSILKSSEYAPLTTNFLFEIIDQAGLPPGVINLLHGDASVGRMLVKDKRVDLISFTGSSFAGKEILKLASENLTKCALELGGKNYFIVLQDANLDVAIEKCILSSFSNSGQRCSSASHILCENKIYKIFRNKLLTKIKELKLGNKNDCLVGPLINKVHTNQLIDKLNLYKKKDFKIIYGGKPPDNLKLKRGNYIMPTLLEDLNSKNEFYDNELFAPIVTLSKFSSLNEIINKINDSKYGLTCAIHTNNLKKMNFLSDRINCGGININGMTYGSEPHMPFGGTKDSGNGFREPGSEAEEIYSELKILSWDYSN